MYKTGAEHTHYLNLPVYSPSPITFYSCEIGRDPGFPTLSLLLVTSIITSVDPANHDQLDQSLLTQIEVLILLLQFAGVTPFFLFKYITRHQFMYFCSITVQFTHDQTKNNQDSSNNIFLKGKCLLRCWNQFFLVYLANKFLF